MPGSDLVPMLPVPLSALGLGSLGGGPALLPLNYTDGTSFRFPTFSVSLRPCDGELRAQ